MGICHSTIVEENNTKKMSNDFQLTRYLYEKEEVEIALMMALINKKDDEALFWAYELYYSGLTVELKVLLWKIYYDFYAVLNPGFEKYLQTKLVKIEEAKMIAMIINNFIIRPFTTDIFFIRQILKNNDLYQTDMKTYILLNDFEIIQKKMIVLLKEENYLQLSFLIIDIIKDSHLIQTLETIMSFFIEKGVNIDNNKLLNEFKGNINKKRNYIRWNLVSKVIYFNALLNKKTIGKNLYVHVDAEDVVMYETIESDLNERDKWTILPAYKILPIAAFYPIDKYNYLSLFNLKRDNTNIIKAYHDNWLYYASFTPVWKERILKHNGVIDSINKKIIFQTDDDLDDFYNEFNYEPDEQKKEVQEKSICNIEQSRTWLTVYNDFQKKTIIHIKDEYLIELEKIDYFT